ncbi:MAG: hypothetical protein ACLFSE_08695 [Spirochaetia bacterium]
MGNRKHMNRRDAEQETASWRSSLIQLPDRKFRSIIRNYLGPVATPYNKQDLYRSLLKFLRREDIRRRITALIDRDDAYILSAIHFAGSPHSQAFLGFLSEKFGALESARKVQNLQERLLIHENSADRSLHLNPVLKEDLLSRVVSGDILFPSLPADPPGTAVYRLGDSYLAAVLSYLLDTPSLLRTDKTYKKRGEAEIAEIFGTETDFFLQTVHMLVYLGLAEISSSEVIVSFKNWRAFASLPQEERNLSTAVSFALSGETGREDEQALSIFLNLIKRDRGYREEVLSQMLEYGRLLAQRKGTGSASSLIRRLVRTGALILISGTDQENSSYCLNPRFPKPGTDTAHHKRISIQPNFEVAIDPALDLPTVLPAAAAAKITRFDIFPHYEITKNSFNRAAEHYQTSKLISMLRKVNGGSLPVNIESTLKQWQQEREGIGLYRGTVLVTDKKRHDLVAHSAALKQYIKEIIAPGVFLLDERSPAKLRKAMESAGIDIPASSHTVSSEPIRIPVSRNVPSSPYINSNEERITREDRGSDDEGQDIVRELEQALKARKLPEGSESRLHQRIKEKMILVPEQLETDDQENEVTEAKGLNYVGKVRIIEKALESENSLLEAVIRGKGGVPERFIFRPRRVYTSGSSLYVEGIMNKDGSEVKLAVRKIFLIRDIGFF